MKNIIQTALLLTTLSLPCIALAWGWSSTPAAVKVNVETPTAGDAQNN